MAEDQPSRGPTPLEYEPKPLHRAQLRQPPLVERAARVHLIVAIAMLVLSSIALDGGDLFKAFLVLFGVTSLLSAAAVVVRAKQKNRRIGRIAVWSSILGILFVLASLTADSHRAPEKAKQVKCASNMRQLGQSLYAYAQAHQGQYPPALDPIVDGALSMSVFTCPSTDNTPAQGATPAQQAIDLSTGSHLSYIYCGKGVRISDDPDTVVLWEMPANHKAHGFNALCADGHVDWFAPDMAADLAAGHNPPRPANRRSPARAVGR